MARSFVLRYRSPYLPRNVRAFVSQERFTLLWVSSSGAVYRGLTDRFVSSSADDQVGEIFQSIWSDTVKRKDLSRLKGSAVHADPGELKAQFPQLAEFLTAAVFEGTKDRRESPTITLWAVAGQWRCSVKDRAEGLVLWLSAPGILELLSMLEDFVLSGDAPWRHDDQAHARNGKRVVKSS